jgi:hypothetical protein
MPNHDTDDHLPSRRHTSASVAQIVTDQIEPETAEQVLGVFKRLDGQTITTRLLDQLPGGRVEWRLHRQLGELELRNRAYLRAKHDGVRLTLAQQNQTNLSADFIEQQNSHYFKDRRARNTQRAKALANPALLERVAIVFNEIEEIHAKYRLANRQFDALVRPGEPLSPDRHALARACGLEK